LNWEFVVKTAIKRRSLYINGSKTSISLENAFWVGLRQIAANEGVSLNKMVEKIARDRSRNTDNLSSAIRLFVLKYVLAHAILPKLRETARREHAQDRAVKRHGLRATHLGKRNFRKIPLRRRSRDRARKMQNSN
jgi:predicted DNA-binding ribbon-helix-helix protein